LITVSETGVTNQQLSYQMLGLLSHVHWLLAEQRPGTPVAERTPGGVSRDLFNKQVDRLSTSAGDNFRDLADEFQTDVLTVAGVTTLATLGVTGTSTLGAVLASTLSSDSLFLPSTTPTNTTTRLHNTGGDLYWNGSVIAGGSVGNWNTNGSGDVYRLTGNVGIGTTTPTSKLTVRGTAGQSAFNIASSTGASMLTVAANGNVGIGTDTPDAELVIARSVGESRLRVRASQIDGNANIALENDAEAWNLQLRGDTSDVFRIRNSGRNPFVIEPGAASNSLYINNSGNVGIGTTTPAHRLSVDGDINLTGTLRFGGTALGLNNLSNAGVNSSNMFIGLKGFTGVNGVDFFNDNNLAMGTGAFDNPNTDNSNSIFGDFNTAIGIDALTNNTTGNNNAAIAAGALFANTTGDSNTASGVNALRNNTTGISNTASGRNALFSNTTGSSNTANGRSALFNSTTGNNNTALGSSAGTDLTTGASNTFLGRDTGRGITTGSNNTILGANVTGLAAGLANNIIIADGQGNQRINVDANGNVGIGTTAPGSKLSVSGGGAIGSSYAGTAAPTDGLIIQGNVGIGTTNPSTRLTVFDTSATAQQRIAYDATTFAEFQVDAIGDLIFSASGGNGWWLDENVNICAGGACPGLPADIGGTGNLAVENTVIAGDLREHCPAGYVWVPGSAKYGTLPGFCMMKYEAKNDGSNNAVSTAAGTPWVSISQVNARLTCEAIGPEYRLISEPEWMTVAEQIATLPINDLDSDAGLQLATGHSDNGPASNLAAVGSADPVTTGCNLMQPLEHADNAYSAGNCELRGTGAGGSTAADKGYYGTTQQWSATGYSAGAANQSQLRTHALNNGEVVWDVAGNVWEWTDAVSVAAEHPEEIASVASEWLEYTAGINYKGLAYLRPPVTDWSSANGVGQLYTDVGDTATAQRAFLRGGVRSHGSDSGVFTLLLSGAPSIVFSDIGFRCAR